MMLDWIVVDLMLSVASTEFLRICQTNRLSILKPKSRRVKEIGEGGRKFSGIWENQQYV